MAQPSEPSPKQDGRPFGRYTIVEKIGAGAMGMVYRGFDARIGRPIAIKILRVDLDRDSPEYGEFMERFRQEARASGSLMHPSIVTIFDMDEVEGTPFIAMELLKGQTLASMLTKGRLPSPAATAKIIEQVAAALDYAHERGIVHRDVKPANIMICKGGIVKLMDFGVARIASNSITRTGSILGSPSYMAPEQFMGMKVDGKADQFSLGVVAYEVLTGRKPFPGKTITQIMHQILHDDVHLPASFRSGGQPHPTDLDRILARAMAKKPGERFDSSGSFARKLGRTLQGDSSPRRAPAERPGSSDADVLGDLVPPAAANVSSAETEPHDLRMNPPARGSEATLLAVSPLKEDTSARARVDPAATMLESAAAAPAPVRRGRDHTVAVELEGMEQAFSQFTARFDDSSGAPATPPEGVPLAFPPFSAPEPPTPAGDLGVPRELAFPPRASASPSKVAIIAAIAGFLAVVAVVALASIFILPKLIKPGDGTVDATATAVPAASTPLPVESGGDGSKSQMPTPASGEPSVTDQRITIESVPTDCEVFIDGAFAAFTPYPVRLDAGEHTIEVKLKGYRDFVQKVRIPLPDGDSSVVARLEPDAAGANVPR